MKKVNKGLIFLLIFLFFGCASGGGVKRYKDRNLVIRDYLDDVEKAPPLLVDVIYARDVKNRGWEVGDYKVEIDDVLEISIWQVEELTRTVIVRPDGKISFPLVGGNIQAQGKPLEELEKDLAEKLSKYIKNPRVAIMIQEFGGKRAVVIKESGGGGVLRFTTPITVMEALAMSGGYNASLNLKKIYIIREPKEGEHTKIIVVNAQDVLRRGDIRENVYIRSQDVIFLARGWLASVEAFQKEVGKIMEYSYSLNPKLSSATQALSLGTDTDTSD